MKRGIELIHPNNIGWIEYKLDTQEMDYVWKCIENKKEKDNARDVLAGQVSGSYFLKDTGDWFYHQVIAPCLDEYNKQFRNLGDNVPINSRHPFFMQRWWVNYQKQHEFNPVHNHTGLYSFVVWMKVPYNSKEQNLKYAPSTSSNQKCVGSFQFQYVNMLGDTILHGYPMDKSMEGKMLFFPSRLHHSVYPFYNCDEERISVSGNIALNSNITIQRYR